MERDDLLLVSAVCECGSLAGAARQLNLSAPVVTKRLAALERRAGHRLFHRTTRSLSPTAEGLAVLAHAQSLLQGFAALEADLQERRTEVGGTVRLAATFGFGRRWLGPALAQLQREHPGLQFDLQLSEHLPDLAAAGFDGAVWLSLPPAPRAARWVSRRLARNQRVLVASPAYLARRGAPAALADLEMHDCLLVHENDQRFDTWSLQRGPARAAEHVRVRGPLSSNSGELARDWCLAGNGIVLRSLWDVALPIARGTLVRVLPDYALHDADIHWLAPWQPRTPQRIRLLIDFLAERFLAEPWALDPARSGRTAPPG